MLLRPPLHFGLVAIEKVTFESPSTMVDYNMYKPEFVQENETHKILWDFQIQTNPLIPARRPAQIRQL